MERVLEMTRLVSNGKGENVEINFDLVHEIKVFIDSLKLVFVSGNNEIEVYKRKQLDCIYYLDTVRNYGCDCPVVFK